MRPLLVLLPLLALQPFLPAAARAQDGQEDLRVMMCEMIDESGTGWVPDFLMLTRQDSGRNAGRIEVFDPILQRLVHRPIKAVVTEDSARARTYGWALGRVTNDSGQYAERLDYRLRVRKSDGEAELLVTAAGYENTMRGVGRCLSP